MGYEAPAAYEELIAPRYAPIAERLVELAAPAAGEAVLETPPPLAVGSRMRFVARFLGRTLEYTYEVREHDPGRRFVMSTREGPFPMETTYAWEDEAEGATRMTLRNRGEPSGFAKVSAPVMALAMRRANEADLRRLKERLEGQPIA